MTDTQLATRDENEIVIGNLTRKQVGVIKRTICKDLNNDELQLFLGLAERKGLDPMSREIYVFRSSDGRLQIITGIDGFRSRADATGKYMPGPEPTFTYDDNGKLLSATAYVQRWDERTKSYMEVSATSWLAEQVRNTPNWQKMEHVMLAKCAEAMAFRRAFPAQLGGVYTREEMPDNAPPLQDAPPPAVTPEAEARLRNPTAPKPAPKAPPKPEPAAQEAEFTDVPPSPPAKPATPAPATEEPKGRKTRCKGCGELFPPGIVVKGQCEACRAPAQEPEPAPDPMAQGSCSQCGEVMYAAQLTDGICADCAAPAEEPAAPATPAAPSASSAPQTSPRDRFLAVLMDGDSQGWWDVGEALAVIQDAYPGLAEADQANDFSRWTEAFADEVIALLHGMKK